MSDDVVEMKVSTKKSTGFYIRATINFLKGLPAVEATEGKPALEAKEPVDKLNISGVGDAINTAVAAAANVTGDGLATITSIKTQYPEMADGRTCAQIVISLERNPSLGSADLKQGDFVDIVGSIVKRPSDPPNEAYKSTVGIVRTILPRGMFVCFVHDGNLKVFPGESLRFKRGPLERDMKIQLKNIVDHEGNNLLDMAETSATVCAYLRPEEKYEVTLPSGDIVFVHPACCMHEVVQES